MEREKVVRDLRVFCLVFLEAKLGRQEKVAKKAKGRSLVNAEQDRQNLAALLGAAALASGGAGGAGQGLAGLTNLAGLLGGNGGAGLSGLAGLSSLLGASGG